jgi:ABC-type phosphate transport system substrate-binding protein
MAEPVVIVNTANSTPELTVDQISDIFLKKKTTFDGGLEALPVNLKEGEQLRQEFYEKASQKSPSQLKAYWSKSVFTGKKIPPKDLNSADEVKKFVSSTPGGIGYIDKAAADSTVKVILVVK